MSEMKQIFCPCGGVILADTEDWETPLCVECWIPLRFIRLDIPKLVAENARLRGELKRLESADAFVGYAFDGNHDHKSLLKELAARREFARKALGEGE